ncbi:thymidine phosphorylase [Methylobacterium frigidaeris]|uniref:Thymidine phosphorylase n=1 Tax=Methylobacterium frigidaeris TaxID=2038277 RepID=A0AA37HDM4_9HYPH|nr:thymidine phosphorylase [Methylobacterium frigidaeris]PIK72530.1 thymidine phosphorylase [Methylobacterium frigidaeris]GJD64066.1 Thymidine phosphorylase [Methylobacterium frigidaeris]
MTLLPQELIRLKRDGHALPPEAIEAFIAGLTEGRVTEGQAAAFAMAVFFRGLSLPERVALTRAMTRSGTVLDWDLPGPVVDKHSTGGVGDTVSLALAPMVASCGGYVPMIAGRGLGHTGGTLDKLDSIPGYISQPDVGLFRRVTREVGCAVIGQTPDLAPADRRLYAIRDVTGTVESLDLITASILAKKLAAGLQGLVMDVKAGSGAFMARTEDAYGLAESLVTVANGAGMPTRALLTDMDQPLASVAGNAAEVAYAIDYLTGRRREPRFHAVTLALGAEMLVLGTLSPDIPAATARLEEALASGRAAETFSRMVAALGGPSDLVAQPERHLPAPPVTRPVVPPRAGRVTVIATRAVGVAVIGLGGGRTRPEDRIDHAVGLTDLAAIGTEVGPDRPLAVVHARSEAAAARAEAEILAAYQVGPEAVAERKVILGRVE